MPLKLSAPIFQLKRKAKLLARETGVPLNTALDQIAKQEGFRQWSLLATQVNQAAADQTSNNDDIASTVELLEPGDLILVAARPGHGKTTASLEMLLRAVKSGRSGVFFTLVYNQTQAAEMLLSLGNAASPEFTGKVFTGKVYARQEISDLNLNSQERSRLEIDCSDDISAPYIIERLSSASTGTVVVIDYLQLLDQKRTSPDLDQQLCDLKQFATDRGICMIIIGQVHRSLDIAPQRFPTIADVRLPNPVDLGVFNKTCFLHNQEIVFSG